MLARTRSTIAAACLILVLALSSTSTAGTTGKIAGTVTDHLGNPVIGATVLLLGTPYGTMTDANGEYFIINLQPGTYDLQARIVGMETRTIEGVQVLADLTSRIDFHLASETVGHTYIQVTDQRSLILKEVTTTLSIVDRQEIRTMPVAGLQDLMVRQAGSTLHDGILHVRGGRTGEVAYLVDGVSQIDPINNTMFAELPLSAISETSVMSGGFGAEYGNAQSGVVNIVTREGSEQFTGELLLSGNNWSALGLSDESGWSQGGPFREKRLNLEAAVGGPEPLTSSLLPAIGVSVPGEVRFFASAEWLQIGGGREGDGYWMNEWEERLVLSAKLTHRITPATRLNLSCYYDNRDYGWVDWAWNRYETPYIDEDTGDTLAWGENVEWGLPSRFMDNYSITASLTRTLSENSFLELRLNHLQNYFYYRIRSQDGGFIGEGYDHDDWLGYTPYRVQDTDGFYRDGHHRFVWGDQKSLTYSMALDLTSQVSPQHQIKAGVEARYFDVYDFSVDAASGGNIYLNEYHSFPNSGGIYVQDRMEYRGMIVNAGLRFDYFDPNFDSYPADPGNPVQPGTTPEDPDHIIDPVSVPIKYHVSPRIGFSHPVTERDVLHFTYGHYFQNPGFFQMYYGSDYDLSGGFPLVGNPDLEPEETVSYEVGVRHQFDDVTLLGVTGFYKDITGLVDTERNFYSAVDAYDRYINSDYGNVRGAELNLLRRPRGFWSFNLSYSYAVAKGKSSSAAQNYLYAWAGWILPRRESYLDWDQRHTANLELDFRVPEGEGPRLAGYPFLEGFGAHISWRWGSGFPYSQSGQGTAQPEINGRRFPWTMSTDLRLNREFRLGPLMMDAFMEVRNLFDRRNLVRTDLVDVAWYDADQDGDGEPDHDPTGATGDQRVYDRHRQIRFGLGLSW